MSALYESVRAIAGAAWDAGIFWKQVGLYRSAAQLGITETAARSSLSTAAKHGHTFFETLVMLAEYHPGCPHE